MKINLGNISVDLGKLIESRLLIQANSGGGKSYAIRRLIEQSFGKVQIIVLDPEGEFTNMRQKYDFAYIGKGGDAAAEPRSAALLAHRLLELKTSAIIDLYEMAPQDRKHFVRLFCESMVNAPKELWHDVLVIIDEAHVFAPEKGESEALGPVIDLATRGRKRGYCVVLATQRLPKLNKDAAAECNNKLIGRASQDIDRKRAAEELGFTTRDQILSLRDLEPGEFYVFGPAISREVIKTTIGDVSVKPPPRSQSRQAPPAPSAAVKKVLAKLADLPQEAHQEAMTIKGLQIALRVAEGRIRELNSTPKTVAIQGPIMKGLTEKEVDARLRQVLHKRDLEWEKVVKAWEKFAVKIHCALRDAATMANQLRVPEKLPLFTLTPSNLEEKPFYRITVNGKKEFSNEKNEDLGFIGETKKIKPTSDGVALFNPLEADVFGSDNAKLGSGELRLLKILAQRSPMKMTRSQLALMAGIKATTGTFRNYISKLKVTGMIEVDGDTVTASPEGIAASGESTDSPQTFQELIKMWRERLPASAVRILDIIVEVQPEWISKEYVAGRLNIVQSGTFRNNISILKTNGLIETDKDCVRMSHTLLGF